MVSKAVRDAWELQQLMMRDARANDTTPAVRATLARSWCLVQECIRVMRGIPLPGQLRPDLPPMKGLKGKRGKGSPVLDLPAAQAFSEAVEKVKAEARAAGAQLDGTGVRPGDRAFSIKIQRIVSIGEHRTGD